MNLSLIATKTFTAAFVSEGSWGATSIGTHESTMELFSTDESNRFYIEWDIPAIDTGESIGLWTEPGTRVLRDYDGVACLPREAAELLEANGFVVGEDFK